MKNFRPHQTMIPILNITHQLYQHEFVKTKSSQSLYTFYYYLNLYNSIFFTLTIGTVDKPYVYQCVQEQPQIRILCHPKTRMLQTTNEQFPHSRFKITEFLHRDTRISCDIESKYCSHKPNKANKATVIGNVEITFDSLT